MTVILVVEDDVLANEYLEFILQQAGYEVLSAPKALRRFIEVYLFGVEDC